jgi:hypothetical protein
MVARERARQREDQFLFSSIARALELRSKPDRVRANLRDLRACARGAPVHPYRLRAVGWRTLAAKAAIADAIAAAIHS